MATRARARGILDRSRGLLDRSRVVAAHLLDPPRPAQPAAIGPAARSEQAAPGTLLDVCSSIALRDLNLIDTLLAELEEMERTEEDSTRLGQLYKLDHLAARLRRNAENLRVLADDDTGDGGDHAVSLLDTIRAAMSSIEVYTRIDIGRTVPLGVVGLAADDLSRVLTELLDNATNHSPPTEQVRVSAHLTEQGSVLIRIEDGGIGLPADRLVELNGRLSQTLQVDDDAVRHMGLAVVRRLAQRHDLQVSLHRRLPHGTTATVLVPASLVGELPEEGWSGRQTVPADGGRPRAPEAPAPGRGPLAAVPRGTTRSGLPRRDAAPSARSAGPSTATPPSPVPRTSPTTDGVTPSPTTGGVTAPPATGGATTPNGLPRRVSRSIKGTADAPGSPPPPTAGDQDGHDRFLADLGDFTSGEQAALTAEPSTGPAGGTPDERVANGETT